MSAVRRAGLLVCLGASLAAAPRLRAAAVEGRLLFKGDTIDAQAAFVGTLLSQGGEVRFTLPAGAPGRDARGHWDSGALRKALESQGPLAFKGDADRAAAAAPAAAWVPGQAGEGPVAAVSGLPRVLLLENSSTVSPLSKGMAAWAWPFAVKTFSEAEADPRGVLDPKAVDLVVVSSPGWWGDFADPPSGPSSMGEPVAAALREFVRQGGGAVFVDISQWDAEKAWPRSLSLSPLGPYAISRLAFDDGPRGGLSLSPVGVAADRLRARDAFSLAGSPKFEYPDGGVRPVHAAWAMPDPSGGQGWVAGLAFHVFDQDDSLAGPARRLLLNLALLSGSARILVDGVAAPAVGASATVPTPLSSQAPADVPAQIPTQAATLVPAPVATQTPIPVPSQIPTQIPTLAPNPVPAQVPTEVPAQIPTEVPTEVPAQIPTEVPTRNPTEVPTQLPLAWPTLAPSPPPTLNPAPSPNPEPFTPPPSNPALPPLPPLPDLGRPTATPVPARPTAVAPSPTPPGAAMPRYRPEPAQSLPPALPDLPPQMPLRTPAPVPAARASATPTPGSDSARPRARPRPTPTRTPLRTPAVPRPAPQGSAAGAAPRPPATPAPRPTVVLGESVRNALGCLGSAPEPFSDGGVFVQFCLAQAARVRLSVFDASGSPLWRSDGQVFPAGEHQWLFDGTAGGRPLEPGPYLYEVAADYGNGQKESRLGTMTRVRSKRQ